MYTKGSSPKIYAIVLVLTYVYVLQPMRVVSSFFASKISSPKHWTPELHAWWITFITEHNIWLIDYMRQTFKVRTRSSIGLTCAHSNFLAKLRTTWMSSIWQEPAMISCIIGVQPQFMSFQESVLAAWANHTEDAEWTYGLEFNPSSIVD